MKPKFFAALSIFGDQVTLDDETFSTLEEYTCCLYGSNGKNIKKLRFQKFTQKWEEKYVDLALLPPSRKSFVAHPTSKSSCLLDETCKYCNSSRATPQYCRWDVTGNTIWVNEHFPEKIVNVVHIEYQGSDVIDYEDFDEPEFSWEGASDDSDTE